MHTYFAYKTVQNSLKIKILVECMFILIVKMPKFHMAVPEFSPGLHVLPLACCKGRPSEATMRAPENGFLTPN